MRTLAGSGRGFPRVPTCGRWFRRDGCHPPVVAAGAVRLRAGRWGIDNGGTLFLSLHLLIHFLGSVLVHSLGDDGGNLLAHAFHRVGINVDAFNRFAACWLDPLPVPANCEKSLDMRCRRKRASIK